MNTFQDSPRVQTKTKIPVFYPPLRSDPRSGALLRVKNANIFCFYDFLSKNTIFRIKKLLFKFVLHISFDFSLFSLHPSLQRAKNFKNKNLLSILSYFTISGRAIMHTECRGRHCGPAAQSEAKPAAQSEAKPAPRPAKPAAASPQPQAGSSAKRIERTEKPRTCPSTRRARVCPGFCSL